MNGADAAVKCLAAEGVEFVFGYPGVAICPFYDSILNTDIKTILVRQEQNAAHEASGYARISGKPGSESSGVPASPELNAMLEARGSTPVANSARLADLLRRPQVTYADIAPFDAERPVLSAAVTEEVEIQVKYAGYLERQQRQVKEFKKEEARLLPPDIDYHAIVGLRLEAKEKLQQIRPMSLGQAGRISGVSPADIAVLMIWLEQQ